MESRVLFHGIHSFLASILTYFTYYLLTLLTFPVAMHGPGGRRPYHCLFARASESEPKGSRYPWLRGDFANWADFSAVRSCAVRQCLTRCLSVPASVSVVSVTVLQSFLMSRSEKYSGMKNACEIDMSENDCTVLCVHCVWICHKLVQTLVDM